MANDNGLVDEYEKLQKLKEDTNKQIDEIKEKIIRLSREKDTNILFGNNKKCSVKEYEKIIYPEDKTILMSTIKSKGLYENLSSLNYLKLSSKILKREVDQEIINLIKKEKAFRLSLKDIQ